MKAVIECEKGTKIRYEQSGEELVVKGLVKHKWIEAYGFIQGTLQADGDELDCYVIGKGLKRGEAYDVEPVCLIVCWDEGLSDDKLICVTGGVKAKATTIKRLVKAVSKYKKDCTVVGILYNDKTIDYEVVKCRLYRKLFKEA